jgi:hypothetical protein
MLGTGGLERDGQVPRIGLLFGSPLTELYGIERRDGNAHASALPYLLLTTMKVVSPSLLTTHTVCGLQRPCFDEPAPVLGLNLEGDCPKAD